MSVGLIILLVVETYRASSRRYYKQKAKKYGYDGLDHDGLWRPLDSVHGRRLSRNEARALAQHRRGMEETDKAQEEWMAKGNVLPNYGEVRQADDEEQRRWVTSGEALCGRQAKAQHGRSASHASTQSNGQTEALNGPPTTSSSRPAQDPLRISWSASPPYPGAVAEVGHS